MDRAIDLLPERDAFYWEARRICEKYEIPPERLPSIELGIRHRAFMEAIQPILRAQADVIALAMPTLLRGSNGQIKALNDGLSDEQRALSARLGDMIIEMAQQYDFDYCPLPASPTPPDNR